MYGRPGSDFGGIQLFDKDDVKLLEAGYIKDRSKVIELKEDERIIGVKAKNVTNNSSYVFDLQFINGWLE